MGKAQAGFEFAEVGFDAPAHFREPDQGFPGAYARAATVFRSTPVPFGPVRPVPPGAP